MQLLKELAAIHPELISGFMPQLADLARLATFQHAFNLHETIWKALPVIAKSLGTREFKRHLERFLGPLFSDLKCGHQLSEVAAGTCIGQIRDFLGPRIFAGRLADAQRAAMASDANVPPPAPGGLAAAAMGVGPGPAAEAGRQQQVVDGVAPWLKAAQQQQTAQLQQQ